MSATIKRNRQYGGRGTHDHCLMCGTHNPLSLHLHFVKDGNGVHTRFKASSYLQGYSGILHGGVIAALLDSAMTHCLFQHDVHALTADLRVRFHRPVPCDAVLDLRATLVASRPPLFLVHSRLYVGNDLMAEAEAKFMEFDNP